MVVMVVNGSCRERAVPQDYRGAGFQHVQKLCSCQALLFRREARLSATGDVSCNPKQEAGYMRNRVGLSLAEPRKKNRCTFVGP